MERGFGRLVVRFEFGTGTRSRVGEIGDVGLLPLTKRLLFSSLVFWEEERMEQVDCQSVRLEPTELWRKEELWMARMRPRGQSRWTVDLVLMTGGVGDENIDEEEAIF